MRSLALRMYHRLPPPARSAVATLRGWQLRSWRYGAGFDRLVEDAAARERWSPERWDAYREERLGRLLLRAATRVPYYRRHHGRRHHADLPPSDWLGHWPILQKESVRAKGAALLADDCSPRRLFAEQTSGTTGTPLTLWKSQRTLRLWYALSEARWRNWYGVSRRDRWAIVGGQLVVPVRQRRPPFWVWNAALRQLYMSAYHLAPDLIPSYLDALVQHRVTYVYGYTSALLALAHEAVRLGRRDVPMAVAITNAEPLFPHEREVIARAFQCPVRETYGMAEFVTAASECAAGRLHLWPEAGVVEILDGDRRVSDGTTGDLVCTGLLNEDMPLVRYRVGDRAALMPAGSACECGRTLPCLLSIEGRREDGLFTRDGRRIGRLDPVFKADLPIREAQIVQETLEKITVRFVPAPGFGEEHRRALASRLRDRLGDVAVVCEPTTMIPRGANGKFRAVICQVEGVPIRPSHDLV
jgi:phenylacetate-CoA ligase